MTPFILAVFVCFLVSVDASATVYTPVIPLPKKRTLVLVDSADKARFKGFFSFLESWLEVKYESDAVPIKKYEEYLFDNIIVFGIQKEMNLDLMDFVDGGNNVMIVARPAEGEEGLPSWLRNAVAVNCGLQYSHTLVLDRFSNHDNKADHILADNFIKSKPIFPSSPKTAVVYHGLGITVESHNPLLLKILTAKNTAYTPAPEDEAPIQAIGTDTTLIAGLQTRIGSRMVFFGSSQLLGDEFAQNLEVSKEVAKWNFQQRGVLRFSDVQHARSEDTGMTGTYRIREPLTYSVKLEEFKEGSWIPFTAEDVQLEFTMIDAYVRQSLKYDSNTKRHSLSFQAPDTYGVYKFAVDYRRKGYAPLIFYNQTTVRPLRLNEYERYIPAAFPYYASVFSMMGSFIIFGFVFLHLKE
eukprot:NODE_3697_length_1303_cov_44.151695_g3233_i0.p1 GENE.NODE_3697_length_1303_cov_44.151695_g3233_i0~~NODE_3697_length_1303_cov_44.151695_g3233_i0.p1  ORF type:complete len:410 (-),score=51.91 NODE_3697_length_1303_cov_44.151695_g3233_i0:20-1249(-)